MFKVRHDFKKMGRISSKFRSRKSLSHSIVGYIYLVKSSLAKNRLISLCFRYLNFSSSGSGILLLFHWHRYRLRDNSRFSNSSLVASLLLFFSRRLRMPANRMSPSSTLVRGNLEGLAGFGFSSLKRSIRAILRFCWCHCCEV